MEQNTSSTHTRCCCCCCCCLPGQAKIPDPPTAATINAAAAAYSDGLTASLLLMGPALLHAVKHSKDGDVQMPAGGGGCPLGPGGVFLKGAALKDAAVNLFGSVIMKICPPFVGAWQESKDT